MVLFYFLVIPFLISAPVQDEVSPRNELRSFRTDGCSVVGNWQEKWLPCCLQHDLNYWAGGSVEDRMRADFDLFECISKVDPPSAPVVYLGAAIGGAQWKTGFEWGYGWRWRRNNEPLSKEELALVGKVTPKNLEKLPIGSLPFSRSAFPSLLGDYCLDEVFVRLSRSGVFGSDKPELRVVGKDFPGKKIRLRTPSCEGEIIARFSVPTLKMCGEPRYLGYPTNYLAGLRATDECGRQLGNETKPAKR